MHFAFIHINNVNITIVLPEFFSSSFELVDNFAFGGDSFHRNDLPRCGWVASVIENVIIVTKLTNIFYQLIIAIYLIIYQEHVKDIPNVIILDSHSA